MQIRIHALTLHAYHGVYDSENKIGGTFEFDVEAAFDADVTSDELRETVDYMQLIERVKEISGSRSYNLIEMLASDICKAIIRDHEKVNEVIVRVRKIAVPIEADLKYVEAEVRVKR